MSTFEPSGRGFLVATVSGRYLLALALCIAVAIDKQKRSDLRCEPRGAIKINKLDEQWLNSTPVD
jgi:hypothetical protein